MGPFINIDQFIRAEITHRPESLIQNDLIQYNDKIHEEVNGKGVLVIGGAGTIGSSFIKALLRYMPAKLIVVDINENGLTELVRDCRSSNSISLPTNFKTYPINFRDKVFSKIFMAGGPFDIVANFAAHKHVRSEKDVYSIEAMIDNNVIEAKKLLDILSQAPPAHFFCVSTDKAANPVNIMGASKKLMEEVILTYSTDFKITTARFANVAFSNGSLLSGFLDRIMKQQPLACPSDVKRFFVSPQEAGELCLCACILGEAGDIFFPKLDMENDLISFASVVEPFLKTMGLEADICRTEEEAKQKAILLQGDKYPVYFFESDTNGEKLFEEFYTEEEELDMESFNSLGVIKNAKRRSKHELDSIIDKIVSLFESNSNKKEDVVAMLNNLLPGFQHIETGINLDEKM